MKAVVTLATIDFICLDLMKSTIVKESRFHHCYQVSTTILVIMKFKGDAIFGMLSLDVNDDNGVNSISGVDCVISVLTSMK